MSLYVFIFRKQKYVFAATFLSKYVQVHLKFLLLKILSNLIDSYIFGKNFAENKSRSSFNYFGEFFSPENFAKKLTEVICACLTDQLIEIFRLPQLNSTSENPP